MSGGLESMGPVATLRPILPLYCFRHYCNQECPVLGTVEPWFKTTLTLLEKYLAVADVRGNNPRDALTWKATNRINASIDGVSSVWRAGA